MSSSSNSLRPAWNRGNKGFQPPPQVATERNRSQSIDDHEKQRDYNKFSALDDEEDVALATGETAASHKSSETNSRSEALRSGIAGRSSSVGGKTGRSLTDLAARAPERTSSRFSTLRTQDSSSETKPPAVEDKVVRFTRERLLSMRPPPRSEPRDKLKQELEGSLILCETAQDPVCFDNFDAEEIWATVPRRPSKVVPEEAVGIGVRRSSATAPTSIRRETSTSGRWQRGVALPPEGQSKRGSMTKDVDDPSDLWDDPGATEGAAMDFSAFGAMPADDNEVFDFEKMAEASKKLEEEMHGRSRASSTATDDENVENVHTTKIINPNRPLATVGTTIRSGSGDDVNVFEDFDDPAVPATEESKPTPEPSAIKAADEDPTASSRLMAMIGVKKDSSIGTDAKLTAWGEPSTQPDTISVAGQGIPLNPWGDPIISTGSNDQQHKQQQSLDLQVRLRQSELEQKAAEENRRRLEQEEVQRQQQLQERERVRALQLQQQQAGVQSQVELVLMERISTILENSWGRSDLESILATLHAEDSRVIPLLNNVDALRALLLRNPRRVALRQDPALRAEMAALLVTNAQWQQQQQQQQAIQQQQQQQQAIQQQEELQRREQRRLMEEQQAAAAHAQHQHIIPDAPWYYSDPSKNIQGPFRGGEMRQWLEAGYFKGDLPISQSPRGPFRALSQIFTDLAVAFMNPKSASEAEIYAKAEEQARHEQIERARAEVEAAEREQLRAEQLKRQRQEQDAADLRAREEQQRARAEAESKANHSNGRNESSAQLKLMLGLGAQGVVVEQYVEAPMDSEKSSKMASRELLIDDPSPTPSDPVASVSKNAAPAWGGAVGSQPVTRKSMSEIQKEEARAAAVAAMNRQGARSSSSGWANVAAARGGSTAWSGGAAKQQAAAVISSTSGHSTGLVRSISLQPTSTASSNAVQSVGQLQRSNSVFGGDATADAFGATLSPVLEKWCKDQMHRLNGTDDLTLVTFCMTLSDQDEIRQYLTAYLGSTPQVNSFATEFINRKGGAKDKQDEWESTATAKKGRKKKTGVR